MKTLLNKEVQEGNLDQVTVTKFEWLRDIHMFYVEDPNKTMNSLLRKFADLSENDLIELDRFSQRIKLTFDKVLQKEVKGTFQYFLT